MQKLKKMWKENLYKDSIYLILNSGLMSFFGFLFWAIAARKFSSYDVGMATTIVSLIGLIALFSYLGLNISFLRYLPKERNPGKVVFSGLVVSSLLNIILIAMFLAGMGLFSPELAPLFSSWSSILALFAFSLLWGIFNLLNIALIAKRKSNIVFIKNTIYSILKLILLFAFVGLSGILLSWYFACFIGIIISLFFIRINLRFDFSAIKKMFHFSSYNYLSSIFLLLPGFLLPLITTNLLEPTQTAYFYISWAIAGLLLMVPASISQIFLAEGSHTKKHWEKKFKKSMFFAAGLVGLGIVILLILGRHILTLFDPEYLAGLTLLYILAFAAIPYTFNQIYIALFNLQKKVGKVVLVNFVVALITIIGSVTFISYGLNAIGLSWVVANFAGMVLIGITK